MCNGLAVIVEKIDEEWKVYARKSEGSHDNLLSSLDNDIRYGNRPHIKFEVTFPCIIRDDIVQDVAEKYYPEGWVVKKYGKWCACLDSIKAVANYLTDDMIELEVNQLQLANLTRVDLSNMNLAHAELGGANLGCANISGANLNDADLTGANLTGANLRYANLTNADLSDANLFGVNFTNADLTGANLTGANLIGVSGLKIKEV
jgi:uncharacterized protein YjbI with pentapeptide repeats